jgi:NADH-quinone oxidoreductase subunit K
VPRRWGKQVGIALFGPYLLAVELASLLLLGALVAAYHLGHVSEDRLTRPERRAECRRRMMIDNASGTSGARLARGHAVLLGFAGLMVRRNFLFMLMCLEVMMNAVALAFVAGRQSLGTAGRTDHVHPGAGLAAPRQSIGLALLLQLYRRFHSLDIDAASEMRG